MRIIFGLCMGAIINCLVKHEEYLYVALAIIACVMYCFTLYFNVR